MKNFLKNFVPRNAGEIKNQIEDDELIFLAKVAQIFMCFDCGIILFNKAFFGYE